MTNSGTASTSAPVTVAETLPGGLTATGIAGTSWTCTQPRPCSRNDVLTAGQSYPPITMVNVASTAPASVTNTAAVSGGGETNAANNAATDITAIGTSGTPTMIALVQHAGKDAGTTTSSSLAFGSNNTAGNWIGVAIRAAKTGQVFTVTDTRGNTYRKAIQFNETSDQTSLALYYAENIAGGANTVTVADTLTGASLRFAIFDNSGVASTNSLDVTSGAQGVSGQLNSGSATTTSNGDLVLGVAATANSATVTPGTGFVMQERVPVTGMRLAVEDRRQTAAGPTAATMTFTASETWGAIMASFRAAVSGPPLPADLVVSKTHAAPFTQGQVGATYTLTVTNLAGSGSTNGLVTVTDSLTLRVDAYGNHRRQLDVHAARWPRTRGDVLAAGQSYPPITLTVSVASTAPASVTNTASVSGGGETNTANDTASDVTVIATPDTEPPSAPGVLTAAGSP